MTEEQAANTEKTEAADRIARQTLIGDLRDVCINIMKDPNLTGKAWKDMNEAQQSNIIELVTSNVSSSVVRAVDLIRAGGQPNIKCLMKQVLVKDGVKIQLECSKEHERFHDLVDAQGDRVLLVLAGTEEYLGEQDEVETDPDQPELPIQEEIEEEDGEEEANENL